MKLAHIFIDPPATARHGTLFADLRYLLLECQVTHFHRAADYDQATRLARQLKAEQSLDRACIHSYRHFFRDLYKLEQEIETCSAKEFIVDLEEEKFESSIELAPADVETIEFYLRRLGRLTAKDLETVPAPAVKAILQMILQDIAHENETIFLVNNESCDKEMAALNQKLQVRRLFVLASGLKPLQLFHRLGDSIEEVTFYDLSEKALYFYKHLVERWDGRDYPGFIKNLLDNDKTTFHQALRHSPDMAGVSDDDRKTPTPEARVEQKFTDLVNHMGGADHFAEVWKKFAAKKFDYKKLDLVGDFQRLGLHEGRGPAMIWFSNIYGYRPTFFKNGGRQGLRRRVRAFVEHCAAAEAPVYVAGFIDELNDVMCSEARTLANALEKAAGTKKIV